MILKELQGLVTIHKVLRAPAGSEVEELTPLEITEILKEVISSTTVLDNRQNAYAPRQVQTAEEHTPTVPSKITTQKRKEGGARCLPGHKPAGSSQPEIFTH